MYAEDSEFAAQIDPCLVDSKTNWREEGICVFLKFCPDRFCVVSLLQVAHLLSIGICNGIAISEGFGKIYE